MWPLKFMVMLCLLKRTAGRLEGPPSFHNLLLRRLPEHCFQELLLCSIPAMEDYPSGQETTSTFTSVMQPLHAAQLFPHCPWKIKKIRSFLWFKWEGWFSQLPRSFWRTKTTTFNTMANVFIWKKQGSGLDLYPTLEKTHRSLSWHLT